MYLKNTVMTAVLFTNLLVCVFCFSGKKIFALAAGKGFPTHPTEIPGMYGKTWPNPVPRKQICYTAELTCSPPFIYINSGMQKRSKAHTSLVLQLSHSNRDRINTEGYYMTWHIWQPP